MSKKIILKQLVLKNFKGIKNLIIDLSKVTNIFGENATGKTTIFDAFTWLLFDKDSQDRSKFNVQPLAKDNSVIHMLETEVSAKVKIGSIKTVLKKVLKEKWVKKRGEVDADLKGCETSYYIDEVPFKQGEYQKRIAEITGDENIFKLLTNPLYFSSSLKWQDRRKIIFDLNGNVSIEDVINYNKNLTELTTLLNPNEDLESLSKRVKSQKSKLKKDKENIPARIDELNRTIKDDIDFEALEFNKRAIVGGIQSVDEQLLDSSKANDGLLKEKDSLYKLKSKLKDIEYQARNDSNKPLVEIREQLYKAKNNLLSEQNKLKIRLREIEQINQSIEEKEASKAKLKEKWYEEDGKPFTFNVAESICPTCHREFETDDIETKKAEMQANFNENKAEILKEITLKGQALNSEIERLKSDIGIAPDKDTITIAVKEVKDLEIRMFNFVPQLNLETNVEHLEIKTQIEQLETKLSQPAEMNNQNVELKNKKSKLQNELEDINSQLAYKEQNKQLKSRIIELQAEEKRLAQLIADLEKQEYLTEEFTKTKVELLESSINSKFKYVSFKLFDIQVNGGLNETCEALINGVPFSNANTASQINAGLDIINALSEFYGVQAPIFIDNRESVNEIIESESQIINLIVSKDKKLRIESEEI